MTGVTRRVATDTTATGSGRDAIDAPSTNRTTMAAMVTAEEAVQKVREWLAATGGVPANVEIRVHEFDLGYVVTPYVPPPPDQLIPEPGGTALVVDRETGQITTWPTLPPEYIARRYIEDRKAEERFPADVLEVLRDAGWYPGRDITSAVEKWLDQSGVERVLPIFPTAKDALIEFGGLTISQRGPSGIKGRGWASQFYPLRYTPTPANLADIAEFSDIIHARVFPIGGNVDGPSHIVMDEHGRVFLLHPADDFHLGDTMDEALLWVTRGGRRPVVYDDGHWEWEED